MSEELHILGGGPAGLAAGYFAKKAGQPFTIYEASTEIGGNSRTIKHGEFFFDTGAHRFHDQDPEITKEIKELMGKELEKIHVPSQIYHHGRFIDFPLTPVDLIMKLGIRTSVKAAGEVAHQKVFGKTSGDNFLSLTTSRYGKEIASRFLLNYSEKLWGTSPERLSPEVAGKRIQGLNLKTFIKEAIFGQKSKTEHVDGSFYYPQKGIGQIFERVGEFCGEEHIRKQAPVTGLFHKDGRITSIEVGGSEIIETSKVISSLPLNRVLKMLKPGSPREIMDIVKSIRFQNLLLVAVFINKDKISYNASLYFPDKEFAFTRIVEPKNRSSFLSPGNKTSLIVEIPYPQHTSLNISETKERVIRQLIEIGFFVEDEIIDSTTYTINYAYPVLEVGYEKKAAALMEYLNQFENLYITGRSGLFQYTHIHDMFRSGKEIVGQICE